MRATMVAPPLHHRVTRPSDTGHGPRFTPHEVLAIGAVAAIVGALALLGAHDRAAGILASVLADDAASFGAGIAVGAVLVALAAYLTIGWSALPPAERIALWLLAIVLWMAGMVLVDPRLASLRAYGAAWLTTGSTWVLPGLTAGLVR